MNVDIKMFHKSQIQVATIVNNHEFIYDAQHHIYSNAIRQHKTL